MRLSALAFMLICCLWLVGGAFAWITNIERKKQAYVCAVTSYGTNAAIAQCYRDLGLEPPENFDARGED